MSLKFYKALFTFAFILNWFWEMAQMYLYRGMSDVGFAKATLFCTAATFGDAALTVIGYQITRLILRGRINDWKPHLLMAVFGAVFAVIIELAATEFGIWSYKQSMPKIPLFNIGLSPLLQLAILLPMAFRLSFYWTNRMK